MSTVSLSQEGRKEQLEEYIFQRRILLGTTAVIGLGIIVWIVAISTDHWFTVDQPEGVYMLDTRRFFVSSHSGIWKNCRYGSIPNVLPNMTVARNLTQIGQNTTKFNAAKEQLIKSDYVKEFAKLEIEEVTNSSQMTDAFKKMLFATWLLDDPDFEQYRDHYHKLINDEDVAPGKIKKINYTEKIINPTNLDDVKAIPRSSLVPLSFNGTIEQVLVPDVLKELLFEGYETKENIGFLLDTFARDMHITLLVTKDDVTYVLRPPKPPRNMLKKQHTANGFDYKPFKKCKNCPMFPSEKEIGKDPSIDSTIIDYNRSEATFAIITVMVMTMGFIFSIYTFRNPRYMFKRLAGGIHFISSLTSLVVIQVLTAAVEYERKYIPYNFPKNCKYGFGYGYILGYVVFVINLVAFILFLWYSKKRKGDKAATEELGMADEAINIGR